MKIKALNWDEVDSYWETVRPMFQKVVDKAVHGEFSADDIHRYAIQGKITIILGIEERPVIAVAFESVPYLSGKVGCNVLAMGGEGLKVFMETALKPFIKWCHDAGFSWIECAVSPAMERIHHRYGFKTVYRQLRINTGEEA